uniref:Uncharacterized protein n=1 Tax=Romanomermis culicivorax TaxID=13658 RepID=A0A915I1P9_ROMCU
MRGRTQEMSENTRASKEPVFYKAQFCRDKGAERACVHIGKG